jgi:hypothetical protein
MNCSCGELVFCKSLCRKCYAKKRYYENHNKALEQKRVSDLKYREKRLQYQKRYRIKNANLISKNQKEYREKNKARILSSAKEYYTKNKDKILKYQHNYWKTAHGRQQDNKKSRNRRANKHSIIELFSINEWLTMRNNTCGICPRCNVDTGINNIQLDHIIPVSKALPGQLYFVSDIQPLCKSCNSRKADKMEIDTYDEYCIR